MTIPVRRAVLAGLVAGLLAAPAPVPAMTVGPTPGADGVGDSYFPLDGNGGLDVLRYRIRDRYRFRTGILSGRTVLTVRAEHDLSSFHLDFLLPVRGVRVDGNPAGHDRPRRHELRITPGTPIEAGQRFRVRVRYSGRPGRIEWAGEDNWLTDRHEVVAMNQPHMAPWWFPANDHPSDKARMDISITVPRGKQVLANGRRVSRTRHGRLTTHRWRADEPMAPYLATFAAGSFEVEKGVRDGLPWRIAVSRRLAPWWQRQGLRLLRRTPDVVATLEQRLGPYPFSTVGGLVTGLPVDFALETQTLPTYFAADARSTWLVVHEIAHQWFGNSVTVSEWRDLWLNEGAATFLEVWYAEQQGRRTGRAWLRDQYDARPARDGFWDLAIADPGAHRMFDEAVYVRGAMAFQALRNRMGEQAFWELLQTWLQERRHGHGSTAEFEALAEELGGPGLDRFFRAWLHSSEKPADSVVNGLG